MRFRIFINSYLSLTLCFFGSQSVFAQEPQQIAIDSNFNLNMYQQLGAVLLIFALYL